MQVERISGSNQGKITLDEILLLSKNNSIAVGTPHVKNAKAEAEILEEKKADKKIVFKRKRRKGYKRKTGHRQILTSLKILKIKSK